MGTVLDNLSLMLNWHLSIELQSLKLNNNYLNIYAPHLSLQGNHLISSFPVFLCEENNRKWIDDQKLNKADLNPWSHQFFQKLWKNKRIRHKWQGNVAQNMSHKSIQFVQEDSITLQILFGPFLNTLSRIIIKSLLEIQA